MEGAAWSGATRGWTDCQPPAPHTRPRARVTGCSQLLGEQAASGGLTVTDPGSRGAADTAPGFAAGDGGLHGGAGGRRGGGALL